MKTLTRFAVAIVIAVAISTGLAAGAKPFSFPRSTPEAQGVPSGAMFNLIEALDQIDMMNSFMLVRHGHVIAEGWWKPYDAQSSHELYS